MELTLDQAINLLRNEELKLQDLDNKINQTFAVLTELRIAKVTLEKLPDSETETLLPIGAGILLPTEASNKKKVLINVGSDVVVEKTIPEAIEFLESRIKMIETTLSEMTKMANQTKKNIAVLRKKIDEALRQRQQGPTVVG